MDLLLKYKIPFIIEYIALQTQVSPYCQQIILVYILEGNSIQL